MDPIRVKGRIRSRRACVVLATSLLVALTFPTESLGGAQAAPEIEFLNPSSFAANAAGSIVVSDRAATRPRIGPEVYRISAWTKNAPDDAGVEFELLSGGISLDTLDQVTTIGSDTFDYKWDIPSTLPDGAYTLRATLFSENEAIDHTDIDITILRFGDKATVDYPTPGAATADWPGDSTFGTFRPLATALPEKGVAERGKPVGNIESSHTKATDGTPGTTRVRAFYTVSAPGTPPDWRTCGTEKTPGHPVPSSAANDGIRCTLAGAEHQGEVTAVAVLANSSPNDFDPAANQAGDAVRVLDHYRQSPTTFSVTEGAGAVLEAGTEGGYPCHTIKVHLEDQIGREISGANVDVHATGPTDKLRMDTGIAPEAGVTHADRHHTLMEPGHDCFGGSDQVAGDQTEHQMLGTADIKHIESDDFGTSDAGNWGFSFKVPANQVSNERYTVEATITVDETDDGCHANDDRFTTGELVAAAAVGLDKAPIPATAMSPDELERCDRLPALRTISLNAGRKRVPTGEKVRFSGAIVGTDPCMKAEVVKLKARRAGGKGFRRIASTKTDSKGTYRFRRMTINETRDYRAVAPRTARCAVARSDTLTVKALKR